MKKFMSFAVAAAVLLGASAYGADSHKGAEKGSELVVMPSAWQPEHESFALWYAVQQGWDREEGLEIRMNYYPNGLSIIEDYGSDKWVVGAMSSQLGMLGNLDHETPVIAVGNDESDANCIIVRPDSDILKHKGWNPDFPEVYGSPDTIKGKTFFLRPVSPASYLIDNYLNIFGLTTADVNLVTMSQPEGMKAFREGRGDGVSMWAPEAFSLLIDGNKEVANFNQVHRTLPIVVVANGEYAKAHPDHIARYLKVYLRGLDYMRTMPVEKLRDDYLRFYREYAGMQFRDALVTLDIGRHQVFSLDEQIKLFDSTRGTSRVQKWQRDLVEFYLLSGRIPYERGAPLLKGAYVTDRYLKMVKEMQ